MVSAAAPPALWQGPPDPRDRLYLCLCRGSGAALGWTPALRAKRSEAKRTKANAALQPLSSSTSPAPAPAAPPWLRCRVPALPATKSRQSASCQRRSRAGAGQGRLPARIAAADNTGVAQINTGVRCQLGDRRCPGAPAVKRRGIRRVSRHRPAAALKPRLTAARGEQAPASQGGTSLCVE